MKIGFLNNQIDNRGTGNALFDYAHYNEEILGNKSFIYTMNWGNADKQMQEKLEKRFGKITSAGFLLSGDDKLDALYHIKYGTDDGLRFPIPYLVHAVFDAKQIHGDAYMAISAWLAHRDISIENQWYFHVVPHIIHPHNSAAGNLREELGIPKDAIVFGRHGGADSFDIPFVWNSITRTKMARPDVYFLFLGNQIPIFKADHWYDRIIELKPTADPNYKHKFINTCDAMLHARARGETFGIAVGEFDVANRPIITFGQSGEKAHLNHIKRPVLYFSEQGLFDILTNWEEIERHLPYDNGDEGYSQFTPARVMHDFRRFFLNESTWGRNITA